MPVCCPLGSAVLAGDVKAGEDLMKNQLVDSPWALYKLYKSHLWCQKR